MTKSTVNIGNIKAADFKKIGFKSKNIARKFAQLLNINTKGYENASSYLNALGARLKKFNDIGMDFNDSLKSMDTSSKKVKENRIKREEQKFERKNKTVNELFNNIDKKIENKNKQLTKPYKIEYFGNEPFYTIYASIVNNNKGEIVEDCSNHFLSYKKYVLKQNRDYSPWEKTEHTRKKTFVYAFDGHVQILNQYLNEIYNKQKFTFKITLQFSFLLISEVGTDNGTTIMFSLHYA